MPDLLIKTPKLNNFCDNNKCYNDNSLSECIFVISKQTWLNYGIDLENNNHILKKYFDHGNHTSVQYFDLLKIYTGSKIINKSSSLVQNKKYCNTTFIDYINELINSSNVYDKYTKPFAILSNMYVKNSIFKNVSINNNNYLNWYIILDGAGGVSCALFNDDNLNVNNIKTFKPINKFKLEELGNMQIHYKSWFEYGYFKSHKKIISEVCVYCAFD